MWPTPSAHEAEKRGQITSIKHLAGAVQQWPTPSSRDWKDTPGMATQATNPDGSERKRMDQLARAVYQETFPTPDVGAAKGRGATSASGRSRLGGALNPAWVEWLMGVPTGWTALGSWETE